MNTEDNIIRASGLNRNSNDIILPPGSLVAGDECIITKDNVISRRRGFFLCNSGLPAAKPEQIFVSGGRLYVHINNQLWYQDTPCVYANTPSSPVTFDSPYALWGDSTELYITSLDNTIRKVTFTNPPVVSLVAAGQPGVAGSTDGTGAAATFDQPLGISGDATYVYVADSNNHTIRRITRATRAVTTWCGQVGAPGYANGVGILAQFDTPIGLAMNAFGTALLVCDSQNHVIRGIDPATANVGLQCGIPGSPGITDGALGVGELDTPVGCAWKQVTQELAIVQSGYDSIRFTNVLQELSTFSPTWSNQTGNSSIVIDGSDYYITCGSGGAKQFAMVATSFEGYGNYGYRDGDPTTGFFNEPNGLWKIGDYIYVADTVNELIRRFDINTLVSETYIGTPGVTGNQNSAFLPPLEGPT